MSVGAFCNLALVAYERLLEAGRMARTNGIYSQKSSPECILDHHIRLCEYLLVRVKGISGLMIGNFSYKFQ